MKKLLVVVDYQKDFVDGTLGFIGAEDIAQNIAHLIKKFRSNSDDVIFTLDTHDEHYFDTVEGKKLPIRHCVKNEDGWELHPLIKQLVGSSLVIEKPTFGSAYLGKYIEQHDYDEIYLCGLVSNICVFSNAVIAKSFASSYTTIKVVRSATASNDLDMQEKSFDVLKNLHIEVID